MKKHEAKSEGHHGSMHEHHKKSHKKEEKKSKMEEKKKEMMGKEMGEKAKKAKKAHKKEMGEKKAHKHKKAESHKHHHGHHHHDDDQDESASTISSLNNEGDKSMPRNLSDTNASNQPLLEYSRPPAPLATVNQVQPKPVAAMRTESSTLQPVLMSLRSPTTFITTSTTSAPVNIVVRQQQMQQQSQHRPIVRRKYINAPVFNSQQQQRSYRFTDPYPQLGTDPIDTYNSDPAQHNVVNISRRSSSDVVGGNSGVLPPPWRSVEDTPPTPSSSLNATNALLRILKHMNNANMTKFQAPASAMAQNENVQTSTPLLKLINELMSARRQPIQESPRKQETFRPQMDFGELTRMFASHAQSTSHLPTNYNQKQPQETYPFPIPTQQQQQQSPTITSQWQPQQPLAIHSRLDTTTPNIFEFVDPHYSGTNPLDYDDTDKLISSVDMSSMSQTVAGQPSPGFFPNSMHQLPFLAA